MTSDEALSRLESTYHSPLLGIVRAEVERLRADLAAARALLREAYVAMREPTGEWHDIKCNTVLPKIHAALWEKP